MISPRKANIGVLTLGGSVRTPKEGIEADVLVVNSFEELNQPNVSQKAKGIAPKRIFNTFTIIIRVKILT